MEQIIDLFVPYFPNRALVKLLEVSSYRPLTGVSSIAFLALTPQRGGCSVTAQCEAGQTHTGQEVRGRPSVHITAAATETILLTYWRGGKGGRGKLCRHVARSDRESEHSHLHTFHRNHLCCGPCSSERGQVLLKAPLVDSGGPPKGPLRNLRCKRQ